MKTHTDVVVIGGGATGLELALYLSEQGCSITIIEMLPKIGSGMEAVTKKVILKHLKKYNTAVMTDTRLLKIEDSGVVVVNQDNREKFLEAEKVAQEGIAAGLEAARPGNTTGDIARAFYAALEKAGIERDGRRPAMTMRHLVA